MQQFYLLAIGLKNSGCDWECGIVQVQRLPDGLDGFCKFFLGVCNGADYDVHSMDWAFDAKAGQIAPTFRLIYANLEMIANRFSWCVSSS